jgi:hypothetical protein
MVAAAGNFSAYLSSDVIEKYLKFLIFIIESQQKKNIFYFF